MSLDLGTGYNPTPQEVLNKVLNTTGTSPALNVSLTADAITISAVNTSPDAGLFRVSGILTAGVSSSGAQNFVVSAKNGDAGTFRVSSVLQYNYFYMSATGIQTIKASPGILHSVVLNTSATGSTLKIFDNTSAASGLQIANMNTGGGEGTYLYDVTTIAGLTISAAGATQADLTVTYV